MIKLFTIPAAMQISFLVGLIFLILKVVGAVSWSWLTVVSPFLVFCGLGIIGLILAIAVIAAHFPTRFK